MSRCVSDARRDARPRLQIQCGELRARWTAAEDRHWQRRGRQASCSRRDRFCTPTIRAIEVERLKSFASKEATQFVCPGRGKSKFGSTASLATASRGALATRPSRKTYAISRREGRIG